MILRWTMMLTISIAVAFLPQNAQAKSNREKAQVQKEKGDKLLANQKIKQAIKAYQQAIRLAPQWYKSHEALGNLYFSKKRYPLAIKSFLKAIQVEPRYHTGLYNIAFAYRKSGKPVQAVKYYQKYIDRGTNDPDAYYGMAVAFESMGKKQSAITAFLKYVKVESRPSERKYVTKAKNRAAHLQQELQPSKPATTTHAPQVAKRVATDDAAKRQPANTTATTRRHDAARVEPKNIETSKKQPPQRTRASGPSKAVSTAVNYQEAIKEGDGHFKQKAFNKAILAYAKACQFQPKTEEALFKLAVAYATAKNYRAGIDKWKEVLAINPNNTSARRNIERAQARMAKSASSVRTSTKTKKLKSGSSSFGTWAKKAMKARRAGDAVTVLAATQKALKIKKDVSMIILKAEALAKLRHFPEAKNAFSEAMVLNPNLAAPFFGLGEIYRLRGDKERARYYYKMYLRSEARDVKPSQSKRAQTFLENNQ
jgi:tetratricopeptide (TPR) repeat protein